MATRIKGDVEIPKPIRERRRATRIDERLPFKIGHRGYAIQAFTQNISTSGVMCLVEEDIPMMTQLEVALSLPGASRAQKIRMKGVLVRKEKDPGTGHFLVAVFFSDIQPADRKKLEKFIEHRLNL